MAVRLGGDEFVLLLPNQITLHLIENLGYNLAKQLSDWQRFEYPIQVSASIGIVQFPQDGNELRTHMKKADTAMYKAKVNGKSTYCHYHSSDR
ncbi:hypothetical protein BTR23_09970 [Alkalihalophilus pseudofirmus]|nr:hypothetical protein BTR23_09970 [Alkalihalophilus pseudofirmus]